MNNNNDTDIEGAESELLIFADHAYAKVEEFVTDVTDGSGDIQVDLPDPDTDSFTEVKIDAKYHKHIIAKGGSTINKLKSDSDVTINIPDSDSGVTLIRIEGNTSLR